MAARRLAGDLGLLVHRLKQEMREVELFDLRRIERVLRIDQLQLVAGTLHQLGAGLGADADPVDRARHGQRAVGLDGDLEARSMQRTDQLLVDLQHRLAAGQHHVRRRAGIAAPHFAAGAGEVFRRGEFAAAWPVGADEIGVAEIADGAGAVLVAARPQIAAGEAAEHGGAAGLHPFALQRVVDFLDRIHDRKLAL